MKRRWWRITLAAVVLVTAVSLSAQWGLLDWLVADGGMVRNVMEGLSWPAGVAALLLAVSPPLRRWFAPGSQISPVSGAAVQEQVATLDKANPLVGRALHLVDGCLPEVGQVGLLQLRVKPAIDTHNQDGSDLPPYVGRDLDEDLEWAIATGGMVLLHGRAAVGKSRAGIEALRRLRRHDPLLVPPDGTALRELVAAGAVPDGAVVWLDDLELYLAAGGLDLVLLQQLCPSGMPSRTVVVATMRDEELARHTIAGAGSDTVGASIERAAVDLIAQVQGRRRISVAADLSTSERERAEQVGGRDGRVQRAVQASEGFAEYLAAGTAMMDRWSIGDGPLFLVGQALISAAVDCRRAGHHKPVPTTLLDELHRHYMAPAWRHRDDLPTISEALRWTQQLVLGASSCLQPRSQSTAVASDYLLDRAQNGQSPLPERVNDVLWRRLLDTIPAVDALPVGNAAYHAEQFDIAQAAWEHASIANVGALVNLGVLLAEQGRHGEAEQLYLRAVDAGDTDALVNLGILLAEQGRPDEAVNRLRAVADVEVDAVNAQLALGAVLSRLGRDDEAVGYLRRASDAGNILGTTILGSVLAEQGRIDEAVVYLRRAVDAGNVSAMGILGSVLARLGREDEAVVYLRRAADAGDTHVSGILGSVLAKLERHDEAVEQLRPAADAGDTDASRMLGSVLVKQGREDEASIYLRRAADAGDTIASRVLGSVLVKQGRDDEAVEQLRPAADAGDSDASRLLGFVLAGLERYGEAVDYLRRAVDAGDTNVMGMLGSVLARLGRDDEAVDYLRCAADAGETSASRILGSVLARLERYDEAVEQLLPAADAGNTDVSGVLGSVLIALGRDDEAVIYLRRAADAGDTHVSGLLGIVLVKLGRDDEAVIYLRRAADAGDTSAMAILGQLERTSTD